MQYACLIKYIASYQQHHKTSVMKNPIKSNALNDYLELSIVTTQLNKTLDSNLSIIHGIGVTEFSVMHTLQYAPSNTMTRIDLAKAIGLSASGVTRLLNPMEKIGLVEKQANARDARVSLVKLSTAGKRIYLESLDTSSSVCESFFQPLNAQQRSMFTDLISLLK